MKICSRTMMCPVFGVPTIILTADLSAILYHGVAPVGYVKENTRLRFTISKQLSCIQSPCAFSVFGVPVWRLIICKVSVQYSGGFLMDIILLLTLCY